VQRWFQIDGAADHYHETAHACSWKKWNDQDLGRSDQDAEPAIGKLQMHLGARPAFRSRAKAIPDQQQTDQKLGANRRKLIILRHMLVDGKLIEQRALALLTSVLTSSISPALTRKLNQYARPKSTRTLHQNRPIVSNAGIAPMAVLGLWEIQKCATDRSARALMLFRDRR